MLPVQDVLPSRSTPWVTTILVVVIGVVYVVQTLLADLDMRRMILAYGLVPAHLSWPALFTSILLTGGAFDTVANALMIWVFGDNVEDRLGRGRFAALVIGGGACAGLLTARVAADLTQPIVGTAGLAGVVAGAHLMLLPRSRVFMLVPVWRGLDLTELPAGIVLLLWLTAGGVVGGAWAMRPDPLPVTLLHQVAGLLTGAAAARLLVQRKRLLCDWWNVPGTGYSPDRRRTSRETSASSVSNASN